MPRFRKKPVEVEAIQWDGQNTDEVVEFVTGKYPANPYDIAAGCWLKQKETALWYLVIPTLEGDHEAAEGDWIIRGVAGEHYPCKPDIFEQTYEPVSE